MKKYPAAVQFSLYTAIVSFASAASIFACYFFTGDFGFARFGITAALLFFLLNIITLIVLAQGTKKRRVSFRQARFAALVQLANIPVALFFFWAGLNLMNIARITFINETGSTLQNVRILGCEERMINQLDPGESELLWISIPHDCSVRVEYTLNDSMVSRDVSGYLTPGFGMVSTYNIIGKNSAVK